MTPEDGYNRMVIFLSNYYQRTKLDDLGALLGSMDPFLWTNRKPIDPCMTIDWNRVVSDNNLTDEQCLDAICKFIKIQQAEFKYNLKQIIVDLEDFTDRNLKKEWEESIV